MAAAETTDDSLTSETLTSELPTIEDWLPDSLVPMWQTIAEYPALGALFIVVVFYVAAKLIGHVVLSRLHLLTQRTGTDVDDALLRLLRKPVFNTIFYFGVVLAINAAKLPAGTAVLVNAFASLIVVTWLLAGLRISSLLLDTMSRSTRFQLVESRTIPLFDLVIKLVIVLLASYVLLMIWGINPIGWLASAGIVGIAVGFAAQDTLANLFSGLFIMADSPYKIGDYINLDSGERGKVTGIGMRSTRLLTRDDVEITVPNAVIAAAKITNESGGPYEKMRIRVAVGVAYGSDVDQVCEVLIAVANAHTEVTPNPEPRVRMRTFGASSLDFELLAWIEQPEDRGRIIHELNMAVYKAFDEAGITHSVRPAGHLHQGNASRLSLLRNNRWVGSWEEGWAGPRQKP